MNGRRLNGNPQKDMGLDNAHCDIPNHHAYGHKAEQQFNIEQRE
jgi:hypothetical protein